MTDPQGAAAGSGAAPAGAGAVDAAHGAANPPPEFHQRGVPENPRSRGHSPALDARGRPQQQDAGTGGQQSDAQRGQQDAGGTPQTIKIGDVEYSHDQVSQAIAHQIEQNARKAALPQDPRGYQLTLPPDFKPPEGVKFEFDQNSPELARFRQVAHANGLDQKAFSDALGVYAATKIGEQQQLTTARTAELTKLGSAAQARIDAIDTWLKARVGQKGALMAAQLRQYPVASMVEMWEGVMRAFSGQGGADYSQSGRQEQQNEAGKISGYENMNFAQKRAAQDAMTAQGRGR